jgi:hypothetical protein
MEDNIKLDLGRIDFDGWRRTELVQGRVQKQALINSNPGVGRNQ